MIILSYSQVILQITKDFIRPCYTYFTCLTFMLQKMRREEILDTHFDFAHLSQPNMLRVLLPSPNGN